MKLKDLKKRATTSELALIESVERLVRDEYDLDKIKKEIHGELKNKIYHEVSLVLERHGILNSMMLRSDRYYLRAVDGYYLRDVWCDIGYAVRLELRNDKEI